MVEGVREAVREEAMGAVERAEALSVAAMAAAAPAVGLVDQLLSEVMVVAATETARLQTRVAEQAVAGESADQA